MDIQYYLKRDYIRSIITEGRRVDGRDYDQSRELTIEKGYIKEKADGSALARLGDTQVLVGVSLGVGVPYQDRPKEGILTTSAELRPLADPTFEIGPPGADSIEIARVVDRGIRESGCIDTSALFIEEGKVWAVYLDIHVLDNDGNLFDVASAAAVAALHDTRMPIIEDGILKHGNWTDKKLPVTCAPVSSTFAKIGNAIVLDPTLDEEYGMDARLTLTVTDTMNAAQKGGVGSFTPDEVEECVDKAFERAEEIRRLITE
ncbi:Exosome complex component Rrp42 [uncultured archaeon]|nr:Exosome complex component Rrp42 [uncultured archaeon]